jgi:hypothetical protein
MQWHGLLSKMWKAISTKRTGWGWGFALISALLFLSDKWDSLNSFYEKLKKMGPVLRFLADAAQSPLVQLVVFIAGVVWIGIAAVISARRTGSSFAAVTFEDAIIVPSERRDGAELLRDMGKPTTARFSGIKVSYDKGSMDCMWPVTFRWENQSKTKGVIARLCVDSETESVAVCKAVLTSLKANYRTLVSGVQLPLLFTPAQSPGSDTKAIRRGQSEYLELLWIPNSGESEIMTNFPFAFTEYKTLNRIVTYSLQVAFSVNSIITTLVIDAAYSSAVWMVSIRPPSVSSEQLTHGESPKPKELSAKNVVSEAVTFLGKHPLPPSEDRRMTGLKHKLANKIKKGERIETWPESGRDESRRRNQREINELLAEIKRLENEES